MAELSRQELRDYLFHVRDLELSCYKQRKYIDKIESMRSISPPRQLSYNKKKEVEPGGLFDGFIVSFIDGVVLVFFIMCAFLLLIALFDIDVFELFSADGIKFLAGKDGSLINAFFRVIAFLSITIGAFGFVFAVVFFIPMYRSRLKDFEKTKQENNKKTQQVEEINRKNNGEYSLRKSILEEEYNKATTTLRTTEQTLARVYEAGVVYPKYQGLIPITMFCEYIDSGRCDSLTGHEGAYNIYENEIRLNLILIKLDDIINRLDEIQQNQHMLSNMLRQTNRELENLSNAAIQQAKSLNRIESNTAVASYYSGISAMNTTYLAWAKQHEMLR